MILSFEENGIAASLALWLWERKSTEFHMWIMKAVVQETGYLCLFVFRQYEK